MLRQQGAAGVRIDRIAERLGLTKGSFHHHFDGVDDYHRALLGRYEADVTAGFEATMAAVAGMDPQQAVMALPAYTDLDPRLEGAIRGWAVHDHDARATQRRVDAARLEALQSLWRQILPDADRAETAALVPHLLVIGSSMASPTPTQKQMRDISALLATLVPSVR